MRQELWRAVEPFAFSGFNRVAEVFRIPVDDDRSQQVETGHSVVLSFGVVCPHQVARCKC